MVLVALAALSRRSPSDGARDQLPLLFADPAPARRTHFRSALRAPAGSSGGGDRSARAPGRPRTSRRAGHALHGRGHRASTAAGTAPCSQDRRLGRAYLATSSASRRSSAAVHGCARGRADCCLPDGSAIMIPWPLHRPRRLLVVPLSLVTQFTLQLRPCPTQEVGPYHRDLHTNVRSTVGFLQRQMPAVGLSVVYSMTK